MRILSALAFVLAVASTPCVLGAQALPLPSTQLPQPLADSEKLLFAPPKGFQEAYHSDRVGSLTELVPPGESVEDWTEMITVQVFHGLQTDPAPFLQALGRGYARSCPGFSSPKGIVNGEANGYRVSMLVVRCPLNSATGKPETTLFRVIKGKAALYSVQHAWRSVASERALGDAILATRDIVVCDTHDTTHPCPDSRP